MFKHLCQYALALVILAFAVLSFTGFGYGLGYVIDLVYHTAGYANLGLTVSFLTSLVCSCLMLYFVDTSNLG